MSALLDTVSSTLAVEDARDLRWFFRGDSTAGPQQSTFSAQLERAAMFSFGSKPCRRCGGRNKPEKPGTGFVPKDGTPYWRALRAYRKRMVRELGIAGQYKASVLREMFSELPALACRECPACNGRGWIARTGRAKSRGPITARPTGSSREVGGHASVAIPDEVDIERHGVSPLWGA